MKKRESILWVIIVVLGFTFMIGNIKTVANEELDLYKLVAIFQEEQMEKIEWSLYAREQVQAIQTFEDFQQYKQNVEEIIGSIHWEQEQDHEHIKAVGTFGKKEKIQLTATHKNGQLQTYIIYEVNGSSWTKESKVAIGKFREKAQQLFHGKATYFSCIKGEFSDKMDKVLSKRAKSVLKTLKANEVESLKEETFISISAFSPLFSQQIETKNGKLNLQIALRSEGLGASTTLVVGTPIITIEY